MCCIKTIKNDGLQSLCGNGACERVVCAKPLPQREEQSTLQQPSKLLSFHHKAVGVPQVSAPPKAPRYLGR
jgi:hypothetical protein